MYSCRDAGWNTSEECRRTNSPSESGQRTGGHGSSLWVGGLRPYTVISKGRRWKANARGGGNVRSRCCEVYPVSGDYEEAAWLLGLAGGESFWTGEASAHHVTLAQPQSKACASSQSKACASSQGQVKGVQHQKILSGRLRSRLGGPDGRRLHREPNVLADRFDLACFELAPGRGASTPWPVPGRRGGHLGQGRVLPRREDPLPGSPAGIPIVAASCHTVDGRGKHRAPGKTS